MGAALERRLRGRDILMSRKERTRKSVLDQVKSGALKLCKVTEMLGVTGSVSGNMRGIGRKLMGE